MQNASPEEEELEVVALTSIFGEENFSRVGPNRYRIWIRDETQNLDRLPQLPEVQLEILTSSTYPDCTPDLTCRNKDGAEFWQWAKRSVEEHAATLLGQEMIYDLLEVVKEKLTEWNSETCEHARRTAANGDPQPTRALFLIDHMRSANKYIKLLQKWAAELGLGGQVLTQRCHRNVFVW
eukprot:CAMPEP_0198215506 /NCGR_PEP_ID=MMETSP1445-20131203/50435_1 /TAXON_ID=36898 /ORGANISM="Pyramimonas sp., Strain CCMP2087" /LENGTH=179 /DNA_ID=CAMNT_0043891269 /DNA_START=88 /DNA_END=624 /DNA_ORIENTATION=-